MAALRVQRTLPRATRRLKTSPTYSGRRHLQGVAILKTDTSDTVLPVGVEPSLPSAPTRRKRISEAKPFSEFLTDNFQRQHDYLRISLTERCNLRCLYCMPEEGIQLSPSKDILTTAEIYYLSALFVNQGVSKIRLTGGEPTVRKDIIPLMQQIGSLRSKGLKELALTTNGISLHRKLDDMVAAGLTGVNISLDTLDPFQFQLLTRRQGFEAVMKSINRVKDMNKLGAKIKLKINCVAMRGLNDHQIIPFVEMTRDQDVEVRFIEYMPFGGNKWSQNKMLPYADMLDLIRKKFPAIARLKDAKNDTSKTWQVPGFRGRVGFITSMTHNFCGTCNRLRITSDGNLKVCLHGNAEVSLRDILRQDNHGEPMDEAAFDAIRAVEADFADQPSSISRLDRSEGWVSKERQLLDIIGAAVKRKKEKHAGIGELENMKNRPMILIADEQEASLEYATVAAQYSFTPCKDDGLFQESLQHSRVPQTAIQHNFSKQPLSPTLPNLHTRPAVYTTIRYLMHGPVVAESLRAFSTALHQRASHSTNGDGNPLTKGTVPWGLHQEAPVASTDEVTTGETILRTKPPQPQKIVAQSSDPPLKSVQDISSSLSDEVVRVHEQDTPTHAQLAHQQASKLTHLTSTGEAHMVDVGPKPATRRVAIAIAYITFSNPSPLRLIAENSNKKGDVLGVARIAGIMAAKRTSDIIPLCHPLALSRVEMYVEPLSSQEAGKSLKALGIDSEDPRHGAVAIQALAECVGPTGVEMEAMTAVSASALTVYDMCKGVDKDAVITGTRVVFKSGGRSGRRVHEGWAVAEGERVLRENGLGRVT